MKKYFLADIKWKNYEEGGRKAIPKKGTRYCPLIHINQENIDVAWSIDFICPDFTKDNRIEFKFLVDTAPSYFIEVGATYGVYEGAKKVAEINIVQQCN